MSSWLFKIACGVAHMCWSAQEWSKFVVTPVEFSIIYFRHKTIWLQSICILMWEENLIVFEVINILEQLHKLSWTFSFALKQFDRPTCFTLSDVKCQDVKMTRFNLYVLIVILETQQARWAILQLCNHQQWYQELQWCPEDLSQFWKCI